MQIVRAIVAAVDELLDLAGRLPSVAALRPAVCPWCGHAAHGVAGVVGIVGHGLYWRQVLGVASASIEVLIPIRRYLCGGCEKTISILPDVLHPRRWYAATVILEAEGRLLRSPAGWARSSNGRSKQK